MRGRALRYRDVSVLAVALVVLLSSPSEAQDSLAFPHSDLPPHLGLESLDSSVGGAAPSPREPITPRLLDPIRPGSALGFVTGCFRGQDFPGWQHWLPAALSVGTLAALQLATDPPNESRWERRNPFDDGIRSGLKGGSRDARQAARDAGNALFYTLAAGTVVDYFYLCDRKQNATASDGAAGDAMPGRYNLWRMLFTDATAFFLNQGLTRVAKVSAGRERPYVRPCSQDPSYVSDCDGGRDRNASFYSGHASNTMALATLMCTRHLSRPGSGGWDKVLCGTAVGASLASGMLRISAERHFATDVLLGWVSGAFFGTYVAYKLNYGKDPAAQRLELSVPAIGPEGFRLALSYRF